MINYGCCAKQPLRTALATIAAAFGMLVPPSIDAQASSPLPVAPGPNMAVGRLNHHIACLPDGTVAVFGGHGPGFISLDSAEIYDPVANSFTTLTMRHTHDLSGFAKLADGRYLIAGGAASGGIPAYNDAEVFDPQTKTFTSVAAMSRVRTWGGAATLSDGTVLFAGAWFDPTGASTFGDRYDPATNQFTATGGMQTPRSLPVVLPTSDGKAVVVGGWKPRGNYDPTGEFIEANPELYDPVTNSFASLGSHLAPGESGWQVLRTSDDIGNYRMNDGRYLLLASRSSASVGIENMLFTFDPATKAFARLTTTPDLPNGTKLPNLVLNPAKNEAYVLVPDYGGSPYQFNVTTVDLTSATATTPYAATPFNHQYSFIFSAMCAVGDGRLFLIGGTVSNNSNAVPYTQFLGTSQQEVVLPPGEVVAAGTTMNLGNGELLALTAGTIWNQGLISVNGGSNVGGIRVAGSVILDGSGTLRFASGNANHILQTSNGSLTLAAPQTMAVAAGSGVAISAPLANAGTITLAGEMQVAQGQNSGLLAIASGGLLRVSSGVFTHSGSLSLPSGATLRADGQGTLELAGGTYDVAGTLLIDGRDASTPIAATGTTVPAGAGVMRLGGPVQFSGTGSLVLGQSSSTAGNHIDAAVGATLSLGPAFTLSCFGGTAGQTIHPEVINQGTFNLTGGTLMLTQPLSNSSTVNVLAGQLRLNGGQSSNSGTVQVAAGGTLTVQNTTLDNTGGLISLANNGSAAGLLTLDGGIVHGGTISGNGTFGTTAAGGTLQGVTLAGSLMLNGLAPQFDGCVFDPAATLGVGNGGILAYPAGTYVNDITILLDAGAGTSGTAILRADGAVVIGGSGCVRVGASSGNALAAINGGSFTFTASQTFEVTSGGSVVVHAPLTTSGTVDVAGGHLTYDAAAKVNGGTIHVHGPGAWFKLDGSALDNSGGAITGDVGCTFLMNSATLKGGTLSHLGLSLSGTNTIDSAELADSVFTLEGKTLMLLGSATLGPAATATVGNGGMLSLTGNLLTCDGLIELAGTASAATLRVDGTALLGGNGRIVLNGSNASYNILDAINGGTLTLGAGQTLTTNAGCGGYVSAPLINLGQIDATGSGASITFDTSNLANRSTIRATNGGRLAFAAVTVDNAGGAISADATASVQLNGTTVSGGSLAGTISMTGTTATLRGTTLLPGAGISANGAGKVLTIQDLLTNNGLIELANNSHGSGIYSTLRVDGAATLGGSGALVFNNSDAAGYNILAAINSGSLTNGSGHTLRALAGKNGHVQLAVTNNGAIEATGSGAGIYFDTVNPVNHGTIRATGGGTITFLPATIDNTGGTISADATSTVVVANSTIIGGVLDAQVSSSWTSLTLQDATFAATAKVSIYDRGMVTVRGTVTNNGTISINCTSNWADSSYWARLRADGATTLAGSGTVLFNNTNGPNVIDGINNATLTLGPNQTLTTLAGRSGSVNVQLINQGTVDATGSGSSISLGANTTNRGVMRATAGGTLSLSSLTIDNAGGTISADASSTVQITSSTIIGGVLDAQFSSSWSRPALQDVTIAATAKATINDACIFTVRGTVTNNGTISINCGSYWAEPSYWARLRADGAVTLAGSGTVLFNNSNGPIIIDGTSNATLTLGPNQTLTTSIGRSGSVSVPLINHGTVDAAGAGSSISLGAATTNRSIMRATNGGILALSSPTLDNAGGTLATDATGQLQVAGCVVTGGTLDGKLSGSGYMLKDLTLTAPAKASVGGSMLTLQGSFTNNGTIELANNYHVNDIYARLRADGPVTINGSGVILCNNPDPSGANVFDAVNGGTLTLGASQTLRATASHNGYVRVPLTNKGVAEATGVGGYLWFDTVNPTNRGTMRAINSGALYFSSVTLDNVGGLLSTDTAGSIQLSAATVVGGAIGGDVVVGTWATPTATLRDVTIMAGAKVSANGANKILTLQGTVLNEGTIEVANSYHGGEYIAVLSSDGAVTLNGSGVLLLNNPDPGGINLLNSVNNGSLTLGASQTLRATASHNGYVRVPLTNMGVAEATGVGGYLWFDTCNPTNRGTMRAINSGTLYFNSITVDNTGGLIATDGTGTINLTSATINGGTVRGKLVFSGSKVVNGGIASGTTGVAGATVTFEQSASVVPGGTLLLGNNGTVTFNKASGTGIITNDGLIQLSNPGATGGTAKLQYTGPLTFAGSGVLEFAVGSTNMVTPTSAGDLLTNGPNHTITALAGSTDTLAAGLINQGIFITNATTFNLGTSGAQVTNSGSFQIQSGTVNLTAISFTNQEAGTLSGNGTLRLNGATFANNGVVSPGNSPGTLSMTGDYHQGATGDLLIEINDITPGSYDVLSVSGTAWLAGDLVVNLGTNHVFHANDSLRILAANAVIGRFDHVVFNQGTARVDYQSNGVTLTILTVGTAYDSWIAARGLTGEDAATSADPDRDGIPNSLEFALGGEPNPANPGSNSRALLPTTTVTNGGLVFTFHRKDVSEGVASVTFQWSASLNFAAPDEILLGATSSNINGVAADIAEDTPDSATDTVAITVPAAMASGGHVFGRLRVTMP